MPDEHTPRSFWSSIPGILTGTAALVTALVSLLVFLAPDPKIKTDEDGGPGPHNAIFNTQMQTSSQSCSEICQAQGGDCISARVPSQASGVAGCAFTGVKGQLRSKQCICRRV